MVVRLDDRVMAFLVSGELERDVGEHLVRVHVRRGAGTSLVPVDDELIVVFAVPHRVSRFLDGRKGLLLHGADVGVGSRRGEFHDGPGFDEPGIVVDRHSGDLKVLERSCCLNAIVGVRRDLFFSK